MSDSADLKNLSKQAGLSGLPVNSLFGVDRYFNLLRDSFKINSLSDIRLPYVIITDKNGYIQFTSTGYRIGLGEQILKLLTTVDI